MSYILSFIVAFGVTFIAGQILVPLLRKWKAGQSIREDGPTWHMSKQGTPTMGGVLIAFQKYNPFKGIWGSEWVGFKNFTRFMSSPDFQRYLINTLKLSVYGLLWGFPIPILLAFLLNRIESKKIKQKVQLVLYMPNFISVIVLCGIVRVLLSVTGPVNGLLHTSINFMTLPTNSRV